MAILNRSLGIGLVENVTLEQVMKGVREPAIQKFGI